MPAGTVGFSGFAWPITGGVITDHGYVRHIQENYLPGLRLKAMQLAALLPQAAGTRVPTMGAPLYIDSVKKVNPSGGAANNSVIKNRARFAALTQNTTPTERRALYPNFYDHMEPFDWRDRGALMRAVEPGSQHLQAIRGAFAADADALFLAALTGNAMVTSAAADHAPAAVALAADGATTLQAEYPLAASATSATLLAAYGTDSSGRSAAYRVAGLTAEKINGAMRVLRDAFAIFPGEKVWCICNSLQAEQLANDVRVISGDFNALAPLRQGLPAEYNGCMVLPTPLIASEGSNPFTLATGWPGFGNTGRYAYVITSGAMAWGDGAFRTELDVIPEDGHKIQLAHYAEYSATRMDGAKVVRIECADGMATA